MRTGNGVVFAVAGAKGGVGKTTTSINLSAVLAELGYDVVLVELDLAMANVGDFLDLDVRLEHGQDPTLHEVLAGTASIADATYEAPGGFDVLPSGVTLQGFANADIDAVAGVVQDVRPGYDVVVLDTGAGLGTMTVLPLSLADETILISSPRVASIRDTKKTEEIVNHVDGAVAGIVFIKSGTGRSPGVDRIATHLSVDLLGHVPEDDEVASAQDIGQPVALASPESDAATAYQSLGSIVADRIDAFEPAQQRHREHDSSPTAEDVDVSDFDYDDAVDDGEENNPERTVPDVGETDTADENDADEIEAVAAGAVSDESEVGTDGNEANTTVDDDTDESEVETETADDSENDSETTDDESDESEVVTETASDPDESEVVTETASDPDESKAVTETADDESDSETTDDDTNETEVVAGATDDEIATRLASLESEDTEPTKSSEPDRQDADESLQQTTEQPVEDASPVGVESSAALDDGVDDPTDESRSTVRRLIDRVLRVFGRVSRS